MSAGSLWPVRVKLKQIHAPGTPTPTGPADCPPHGLLQVTKTTQDADSVLLYEVERPADLSKQFLVNSPVKLIKDRGGSARAESPVVVAFDPADGVPAPGETWGPAAGSFLLRKGGSGFVIFGPGTTANTVVCTRQTGGGGGVRMQMAVIVDVPPHDRDHVAALSLDTYSSFGDHELSAVTDDTIPGAHTMYTAVVLSWTRTTDGGSSVLRAGVKDAYFNGTGDPFATPPIPNVNDPYLIPVASLCYPFFRRGDVVLLVSPDTIPDPPYSVPLRERPVSFAMWIDPYAMLTAIPGWVSVRGQRALVGGANQIGELGEHLIWEGEPLECPYPLGVELVAGCDPPVDPNCCPGGEVVL